MSTVSQTVTAIADVAVADAEKALKSLEAAYSSEKAKIVAVLQNHVNTHAAAATAHTAEAAAAQAVINTAQPAAATSSSLAVAPALVLTQSTLSKVGSWFSANWRSVTVGGLVAFVIYALVKHLV